MAKKKKAAPKKKAAANNGGDAQAHFHVIGAALRGNDPFQKKIAESGVAVVAAALSKHAALAAEAEALTNRMAAALTGDAVPQVESPSHANDKVANTGKSAKKNAVSGKGRGRVGGPGASKGRSNPGGNSSPQGNVEAAQAGPANGGDERVAGTVEGQPGDAGVSGDGRPSGEGASPEDAPASGGSSHA